MIQLRKLHTWLLSIFAVAFSATSFSQSLTGIWRGYFTSGGDFYKLEFQIKQSPSSSVNGVSYSYLDVRFYGKATMTGTYIKASNNFRIKEIKTVEVKNMGGGGTCIMNYDLQYSRSGNEEFLEGTFLGRTETADKVNPYEWGQCGGGKVFLRRVATSDFYIEPFLRSDTSSAVKPKTNTAPKTSLVPPATTPKKSTAPAKKPKTSTPPPAAKKPVATKPKPRTNTPAPSTAQKKPLVSRPKTITTQKLTDSTKAIVTEKEKEPVIKVPVTIPDVLKTRQNELMKALVVNSPDVSVKLYDNGEIDDDSISVYLDKRLVLSKKRLTADPLIVKLKMDDENPEHELIMVAENLGRIPPNTSLMIVEAGNQRYEVRITSTEQKNAVVRFKYEKP